MNGPPQRIVDLPHGFGRAQGRTGGVFDNKIGVLDMGDPMRWSDPGLEMRAEDNMPQAREHSAICYDPEVFPETACVWIFFFWGWLVCWIPGCFREGNEKRETPERLRPWFSIFIKGATINLTLPTASRHSQFIPPSSARCFCCKIHKKKKRAAPGVAFGDLWWLGQQMVGWRMANQRLLHCWTTLCYYQGGTAPRPCHRTNEGHYLWCGFSVHQWYGHLVKDG